MDASVDSRAATQWVLDHVDRDGVVVTDDQVDNDPAVLRDQLPAGPAAAWTRCQP